MKSPRPTDLFPSPASFSRAVVDDPTGLLAATATSVSAQIAGPTGGVGVTQNYAGQEVTKKTAGKRILPRSLTVTTGAHAGTYKVGAGNPLVVTGTYGGLLQTENILLVATGGGEIIRGALLYDDPTLCTVSIPGQNDALGTIAVGVADIGAPPEGAIRGVKAMTAGSLVVQGQDGKFDTLTLPVQGPPEWVTVARVCAVGGGDTTTAVPLTVYL